jgi:FKBP-type peptidyl-prolyl cis-trans isomerase SlyD
MKVAKNTVVSFHYDLFNTSDEIIESTKNGDPTLALIGAKNMITGLEQALMGKNERENLEVTLEPYQGYGVRDEEKTQRVPAKYLKHEGKLRKGQIVRVDSNQGMKVCTVLKVGKFSVDLDMNHPLAGQTIRYQVTIEQVRAATDDEIGHGHAHGAGGHHH